MILIDKLFGWMMPFERAFRCTIFLRSGLTIQFTARDLEWKRNGLNELVELGATGALHFPKCLKLDQIDAFQNVPVWRRRWFR